MDQVSLYSIICDVIERAWHHCPVDSHHGDGVCHTSEYARKGAKRIMEALRESGVYLV